MRSGNCQSHVAVLAPAYRAHRAPYHEPVRSTVPAPRVPGALRWSALGRVCGPGVAAPGVLRKVVSRK